jgi:cathepsin L
MNYVAQNGQTLESNYTYTAKDGACRASSYSAAVHVTKVNTVQARSAASLKAAIAVGPVSVTVEADRAVFQRYTGGILNSAACGT